MLWHPQATEIQSCDFGKKVWSFPLGNKGYYSFFSRCDFFTDASLDDAAADTDYAILPGIDTYSGYACPNIGPDSCFADCYFDAGDTIIQDTGTGAVNCPGDQKQTAVICTGKYSISYSQTTSFSFSS